MKLIYVSSRWLVGEFMAMCRSGMGSKIEMVVEKVVFKNDWRL